MGVRLSRAPISLAAAERSLAGRRAGGVAYFAGTVRPDRHRGGRVVALDYEVDPGPARRRLEAIAERARRRFGAYDVLLWHRIGRVRVGEVAVIVAAACAHRAEAFAATRFLIDELKATVPIWKEERRTSAVRGAARPPSARRRGTPVK